MEAPWPSGFCSSCPHPDPPSHTAVPQQTPIQTPSWFTTQPQQPTNKPATQLPASQPPCHLTSLTHLSHLTNPPLSPTCPSLSPHTSLPHLSYLATSPLSPTFPTLLPHLSPPPVPPCYLTPLSPIGPTLPLRPTLATSPLSPSFTPCHPSTFPNLPPHHTPTFPLCRLTALPPFQASQLTTFPPSQLVTLVLRDLTVAIRITRNRISHNLTKAQPSPCNTNLRLQIPHTSNSPTPHIRNTPNVLTPLRQHQGH